MILYWCFSEKGYLKITFFLRDVDCGHLLAPPCIRLCLYKINLSSYCNLYPKCSCNVLYKMCQISLHQLPSICSLFARRKKLPSVCKTRYAIFHIGAEIDVKVWFFRLFFSPILGFLWRFTKQKIRYKNFFARHFRTGPPAPLPHLRHVPKK